MPSKTKKSAPEAVTVQAIEKQTFSRLDHLLLAVLGTVVLTVGVLFGALSWYYHGRALPNTMVASINVGGKTKDEIRKIAEAQAKYITLTFDNQGKKTTASLADVGVKVDLDKTVAQAMNARRNLVDVMLPWQSQVVPLAYTTDLGAAKAFAKEHFPDQVSDALDAQLVFNTDTNSFDVKPGTNGKGFDALSFLKELETAALIPHPIILPVTTAPVRPVIQAERLDAAQATVNQAVKLPITITYQGKLMYTIDPADIAGWTHFTPVPDRGTVTVSYDTGAIVQFLTQKVGPSIARPAVDRKIVKDSKTGKEIVIQSGSEGRQLADVENLAKEIQKSLETKTPLQKEVAMVTAPFKTVTLTGTDRWIEVDLSEQRTSLYMGSDRVATFTISSGVAAYPTVTGEFAIWYKTPNQVMSGGSRATGDYYYLPNVTYVSYFYKDYGFHTAYWHNNFGTPMSHGCINMRQEDAKALYDFAPVGTRVIVHA